MYAVIDTKLKKRTNYHYACDTVDDTGWGCTYRCIQNSCSQLDEEVPSMKDIRMFFFLEKKTQTKQLWLEPAHVASFMKLRDNIQTRTIYYTNTENTKIYKTGAYEVPTQTHPTSYDEQLAGDIQELMILLSSTEKTKRTAIIDDGIYSYCVLCCNNKNDTWYAEIIDPHTHDKNTTERCVPMSFFSKSPVWMICFVSN